jgi:hypothetical protein
MVGCLAVLCAKGVQISRSPAYLERWFRDEQLCPDGEDSAKG